MAAQRCLFEPVQRLGQVARCAAAIVVEFAQFVGGLHVAFTGGLLAAAQRLGEFFGERVERATGGRRDQQGVPAGQGRERREKQQTAQRQDAAGADHENLAPRGAGR